MPTFSATSSNFPLPRLWNRYLRPPFLAYSKLSGMIRGGQVPEVNVRGVVAAYKQIEQSVAIVVEPHRRVRIDPGGQAGLLADSSKAAAMIIVIKLGPSPL